MNEIISSLLTVTFLFAGLVALIRFARTDAFAGPGLGHRGDEGWRPASPARHDD